MPLFKNFTIATCWRVSLVGPLHHPGVYISAFTLVTHPYREFAALPLSLLKLWLSVAYVSATIVCGQSTLFYNKHDLLEYHAGLSYCEGIFTRQTLVITKIQIGHSCSGKATFAKSW
jgi:hypothetical protein